MIKATTLKAPLVLGTILACAAAATLAAAGPAFPLKPSANGRYLVDSSGQPFFYHADTAWVLPRNASLSVAEEYLDRRVKDGFTAIHFHTVSKEAGPVKNVNGDEPFTPLDDILKPNPAYWAHLDHILAAAEKRGLLVSLSALWIRWGGTDREGWRAELTEQNARAYGQFLGARYASRSNLLWIVGGDANPGEKRAAVSLLALGIKDKAPHHLITVHNSPEHSSAAFFGREAWLDLNAAYTYREVHPPVLAEWNRPGVPRPIFLIESGYEDEGNEGRGGAPFRVRRQAYGAILSGALAGHAYGHGQLWRFSDKWREALDDIGSKQMRFVKELFASRAWWKLEPDQFNELVFHGRGKPGDDDYVTAARATDGSFALAYLPKSRTIDMDLGRFPAPVTAAWFDPTDGRLHPVEPSPLENRGTRTFLPPEKNAAGDSDWILILEVASASAPAAAVPKFGVHEVVLSGDGSVANPFDTLATLTFTPPSGAKNARSVYAFFDGDNTWRARVYVSETGEWKWTSGCSTDQGLNGKSGTFTAEASKLPGRLLPHPKNPRHWMTEDGRWFLNIVDTAYFLLSAKDEMGQPIPDEDLAAYVRDAVDHGITSFMAYAVPGPASWQEEGSWTDTYFADAGLTRLRLENFQSSDRRLRWLLDHHPNVGLELILFPRGTKGLVDEQFWKGLAASQKERILRYMVARYAAYPQIFWLVANDSLYDTNHPNNNAYAREVGAYFKKHDPWQHPMSTGHARRVEFFFADEDWATYLHLENAYDLGAAQYAKYHRCGKPVLLGEDRYEQYDPKLDPTDMRYYQRRLYWAWLLSGGSANYGGRWWVLHPYGETGKRPTDFHNPDTGVTRSFKARLTGLDSVRFVRDYFRQRGIELSDFEPDHALVKDSDGAEGTRAPKLMRRGQQEFLIYHPNAAADGKEARVDGGNTPGVVVDLSAASGRFAVEWYRAEDGKSQEDDDILLPLPPPNLPPDDRDKTGEGERGGRGTLFLAGGNEIKLASPFPGHDVVLRLVRK